MYSRSGARSGARFSAAVPPGLALALVAAVIVKASAANPDGAAPHTAALPRFLQVHPPSELGADLQQALSEALGVGFRVHGDRVLAAQASLERMWRTMTKDAQGRVDRRSLRYMVQRYFRQKYHMSIIGMETLQVDSASSAAEAKLLAELAPDSVRRLLDGASAEAGFSLEDAAALVAVIERLVEDSGHEKLEAAYRAGGFDITDLLTRDQLVNVMNHYILRWAFSHDFEGIAMKEENHTLFEEVMATEWADMASLVEGHIRAYEAQHLHSVAGSGAHGSGLKDSWNPLRPLFSFADVRVMISSISTQFGSFWETECERLMHVLQGSARLGTGRVPLSSFHAKALEGEWHFTESAEYLRQLGVLDESSVLRGPQVIVSNYMQSANNCVVAHQHFRVCCASPCQDIYSDLEVAIGAPEGTPEHLLALVSNFTYGLDDAAPRITRKLRDHLQEIARANRGKIPLHGRLFAQWLHFVFPTECLFPHKSNSVSGLSPTEFGLSRYMASPEEMQENADRAMGEEGASARGHVGVGAQQQQEEREADEFLDMWSDEEELLAQQACGGWFLKFSSFCMTLRCVLYPLSGLSILIGGALVPAMRAISERLPGSFVGCQGKMTSRRETRFSSV